MREDYDLVVVGTGFASSFFLYQYLQTAAATAKVLVLERGHLFPHRDRRRQLAGEEVEDPNPEPHQAYVNANPEKHWAFSLGFGGSSNCWYACTPRFMPRDFEMYSRYGVGMDWPVTYDQIEPYYGEVERLMNVAGPEVTPFPRSSAYPLPPHTFSTVDKVLHDRFTEHYISQPTARASRPIKNRSACCVNAVCAVCPVDAKFTIENSGLGVYDDPRVKIAYGAFVVRLETSGDRASAVHFLHRGREGSANGEVIALGANPIFNAAILLNSGDLNVLTGTGIGEQVGLDAVVHLDRLANVGGSSWVTANGYMLYDGEHRRSHAACLIESNNAPYLRLEKGKWRNISVFRMIFEDLPQEGNGVSVREDPLKPRVHFSGHSEYAFRGIERMKQKLPSILSCLPVEDVSFREPFRTEAHILGATRMSNDKRTGVIDRNLIHHQYRNVFVLGAGAFPTYSPANPTLTLCALSMMSARNAF